MFESGRFYLRREAKTLATALSLDLLIDKAERLEP